MLFEDGMLHIDCYGQYYAIDKTNKLVLTIYKFYLTTKTDFLDLFANVAGIKE